MGKFKIVYVIPWDVPRFGGNVRRILNLIKYLNSLGIDIITVGLTPYYRFNRLIKSLLNIDSVHIKPYVSIDLGDEVYIINGMKRWVLHLVLAGKLFLKVLRNRRLVDDALLIHVPDQLPEWVFFGFTLAFLFNKPLVITYQLVPKYLKDVRVRNNDLLRSYLSYYLYVKGEGLIRGVIKSLIVYVYVSTLRKAYGIALNSYDNEYLKRLGIKGVFLSWNGVEKPSNTNYGSFNKRRIVFIGRDERKGLSDVLEVYRRIVEKEPNTELVLIGPSNINIDKGRVISLGAVDENTKWKYLCSSGIYMLFSHNDSFSLSLMEALSCGVPAIVYDLPMLRSIYEPSKSVFFVKIGDIDGAVNKALMLMNMDNREYLNLRKRAMNFASKYSWSSTALRELGIYMDIVRDFYGGKGGHDIVN